MEITAAQSQWIEIESLKEPRDMACTVAHNGSIFVVGGYNMKSSTLQSVEQFQPGKQWVIVGNLSSPREGAAVVLL